jgi:BrnA antitoxin of type II toxin-antitoxin system
MRREYDFSKGRRNPYAAKLRRSVTIRLDEFTIEYFKAMAIETEIPYQTLINLYLRECAGTRRRLTMAWRAPRKEGVASQGRKPTSR